MSDQNGFDLPLSRPRRLLGELFEATRAVPVVVVDRRLRLPAVYDARELAAPRPGWCAIFTKAWSLVCRRHAVLRRCYLSGWVPCLYQHPTTVALVAIERLHGAEDTVFLATIAAPHELGLTQLDSLIDHCKFSALESAEPLQPVLRLADWPAPLRSLVWWCRFHLWGAWRAQTLGTFGIVGLADPEVRVHYQTAFVTSTLDYRMVQPDGTVEISLLCDQRVVDPGAVAKFLAELERVLNHEIVAELRYLQGYQRRAA